MRRDPRTDATRFPFPGRATSKATVSGENYHRGHRGHRGTRRKAPLSSASEKAWHKCRIMHRRMKKEKKRNKTHLNWLLPSCFLPLLFPLRASVSSAVVSFALQEHYFPRIALRAPCGRSAPLPRAAGRPILRLETHRAIR